MGKNDENNNIEENKDYENLVDYITRDILDDEICSINSEENEDADEIIDNKSE